MDFKGIGHRLDECREKTAQGMILGDRGAYLCKQEAERRKSAKIHLQSWGKMEIICKSIER